MTDKQIIIDGIDVSGCENYIGINTKTCNCTLYDGYLRPCKGADCYYKQLKRKEQRIVDLDKSIQAKEQECEELKRQLTILDDEDVVVEITVKQFEEYNQLKAENEELKKIIDEAKNSKLDLKSFLVAESVQNEYEQQLNQLKAENDSLKSELMQTNCYLDADKETIDQLKVESKEINEKLKEKFSEYTLKSSFVIAFQDDLLNKYKQTLTEIKDIALKSDMPPCLDIDCECEYCKDSVTNKGFNCMQYGLEKILQKISECEGNDDDYLSEHWLFNNRSNE